MKLLEQLEAERVLSVFKLPNYNINTEIDMRFSKNISFLNSLFMQSYSGDTAFIQRFRNINQVLNSSLLELMMKELTGQISLSNSKFTQALEMEEIIKCLITEMELFQSNFS